MVFIEFLTKSSEIISSLLGVGLINSNDIIIVRILLFLMFFLIIYSVFDKLNFFRDSKTVSIIVSFSISLIAAKNLSEFQIIYGILSSYSILRVVFVTILPLFVFLLFIHLNKFSLFFRRFSWLLFGLVYIYLITKNFFVSEKILLSFYFLNLLFIFLFYLFDKQIQEYVFKRFKK
jgi:hypothetical protein